MIAALGYAPRPTPLGRAAAGAATIHLWSFAVVALVIANPVVLTGCALGVAIAGIAAGASRALALAARWGAALGVVIVVVNALASQRGDSILVRGPELPVLGRLDISAEAIAEGGVLALRIVVVLAAFAVHTACVDPDRLLRLARPLARRSVLTASLIMRLVPLAASDHVRLREAALYRGPAAASVGRAAMLRRLVAGGLDRAVDMAATLELRGYASGAPGRPAPTPRAPGDAALAVSGLVALGAAVGARLSGLADFESYPTVAVDVGMATVALAAALPALAAAPVALDRLRSRRVPGHELAHA